MATKKETVVASEYNGFPFAAPNDLCLDSKGRIYFTSRPGVDDPAKGNPNAVYRVDPDGTVEQLLHSPAPEVISMPKKYSYGELHLQEIMELY